MTGTMTWVGFDVHARSTHAAAINVMTGELRREKFGPGLEGTEPGVPAHRPTCFPASSGRRSRTPT